MVEVGVVKERLGGDAADIQTCSAEGTTLLDTGDLDRKDCCLVESTAASSLAQLWNSGCSCFLNFEYQDTYLQTLLAGLDGGNVTGDTTSDDDEVLLLSLGGIKPPPSW